MGLLKETWLPVIQEQLFQSDLKWRSFGTIHDAFVNNGFVNLPQSGQNSSVFTNYSGSFPMATVARVDTIEQYRVNEYLTAPYRFKWSEEMQTSYDLQASLVRGALGTTAQKVGSDILNAWAPNVTGSATVFATGASSSAWLQGGQTGTRKVPTMQDLFKLKNILDAQNVPAEDRYLAIPTAMFNAMISSDTDFSNAINLYGFTANKNVLVDGTLPRIAGFTLVERPTVAAYAAAGSKKAVSDAGLYTLDATDSVAAIAFHKDFVCSAYAGVVVGFGNGGEPDPVFALGHTIQVGTLMGAAKLRTDGTGVAALIMGA
jgi:hypothetical protein